MSRTITVRAEFSGVLPTGSFQNMRPGFMAESTFEVAEGLTAEQINKIIFDTQTDLQKICFKSFEGESEKARILKIKQDLEGFRFILDPVSGKEVPSVTSIQDYDKEFRVSDEDLKVYAAQGNLIDAEFRSFAKTGTYKPSSEILECTADRHIIKTHRLSSGKYLSIDGWDIKTFVEKFGIKDMISCDAPFFNRQYMYGGTPDIRCMVDGKKTLLSVKRTYTEIENFVQDSAYANCDGLTDIEQIMVGEFKPKVDGGNECGYSKPRVTSDIKKYFEIFLRRRNEVKKIYGI